MQSSKLKKRFIAPLIATLVMNSKAGDVMSSFADVSEYAEEVLTISAELERENGK